MKASRAPFGAIAGLVGLILCSRRLRPEMGINNLSPCIFPAVLPTGSAARTGTARRTDGSRTAVSGGS